MWKRLRQITGILWVAFGLTFLALDILQMPLEYPLGWAYYLVVWGYFIACIVSGGLFFVGVAQAKWLVSAVASLLVIYALMLWSKASGAPALFQTWCAAMLVFAAWSILLTRRNA
jgi:hypothetical protein